MEDLIYDEKIILPKTECLVLGGEKYIIRESPAYKTFRVMEFLENLEDDSKFDTLKDPQIIKLFTEHLRKTAELVAYILDLKQEEAEKLSYEQMKLIVQTYLFVNSFMEYSKNLLSRLNLGKKKEKK